MKNIYIKYKIIIIFLLLLLFIGYYVYYKYSLNEPFTTENKICCIYAYHEKNDLYKNNFVHFLNNGGILNNIDYYIVVNGNCTVTIPNKPNIKVFFRENKGFDFGAYSYIINKEQIQNYNFYVFLNATVIGPYLKSNNSWINEFINLFNTKQVGIVGTSVCYCNCKDLPNSFTQNNECNKYYIQSHFFILSSIFFNYLKTNNFFNDEEYLNNETKLQNIVYNKEIKMSMIALNNNWNINCYLEKYRDLDFLNLNTDINKTSFNGDPYYINRYFNNTITEYDVIFFKNKRFLQDEQH